MLKYLVKSNILFNYTLLTDLYIEPSLYNRNEVFEKQSVPESDVSRCCTVKVLEREK